MLTLSPVPAQGAYALPAAVLAPLGLESIRRRFLTPGDALEWFLTAPWTQARATP